MSIAGFKRHERSRASGVNTLGLACNERITLRVQPSKPTMVSDSKDLAASHQDAPNQGIGLDSTKAAKGVPSGEIEVRTVHLAEGSGTDR